MRHCPQSDRAWITLAVSSGEERRGGVDWIVASVGLMMLFYPEARAPSLRQRSPVQTQREVGTILSGRLGRGAMLGLEQRLGAQQLCPNARRKGWQTSVEKVRRKAERRGWHSDWLGLCRRQKASLRVRLHSKCQ